MKNWTIEMNNGSQIHVTAEIVTYDNAGNLLFYNKKKITPLKEDEGSSIEMVRCINDRQYTQYFPSPTVN